MFNLFVYNIYSSRINYELEQTAGREGGGLKKKPVVSFPSLCAAIHRHLLAWKPEDIQNLTFAWTNTCLIKSHPRTCNVFVFPYFAVCINFIRKFLFC